MLKRYLLGFVLAAAAFGTVSAQDAQTVIANASKAIGVDRLKTVQYSATGFDFALGQAPNPSSPWPKFVNKSYTRAINFEAPASKVDRVRVQGENPPRRRRPAADCRRAAADRRRSSSPLTRRGRSSSKSGCCRMASCARRRSATPPLKRRRSAARRYNVVTFMGDNKAKVNGYINDQNLVERVETWIDNPFLGDMLFEAIYSDYKSAGGAQFPMHIVQKQGGYPIFDLTLTDVQANAAVSIQPAQGEAAAGGGAAAPASRRPESEKLGDGIYLIKGGYAAIAVDFKDHITIIEAGQSEARGLAVIAEAKRLIPNKPVKYVVNTHSHIDHSSGLRAVVAEGATILTYQLNKAYLEKTLSLPHTLNPGQSAAGRKEDRSSRPSVKSACSPTARVRSSCITCRTSDITTACCSCICRRRRCCSRPTATTRRPRRPRRRRRRARTRSACTTTFSG